MNSLILSRYALSVCVAGTLAGCGGSQGAIGQSGGGRTPTGVPAVSPLTATQEEMYSKHFYAGQCVHNGSHTKLAFKAHGRASGKFPGSFTTHGTISCVVYSSQSSSWSFSERFTVTSGSQTVHGTIQGSGRHSFQWSPCNDFRNANLRYEIGSEKGRAEVGIVYGNREHFKAILLF
ncbi:MAG: hypothetical protein WB609_08980 [Candidatus Cybelea sp.]